jgi:hypothetical protein
MVERKTEEGRSDGVGFDMVQSGEARDKKGEVRGAVVLDAEVVNYQDKGDGARGVAEEPGCVDLVEVEALEEGDKAKIGQLTRLFEAVHSLLYAEDYVRLSCLVLFEEG